jgi:F-type H+-transporting ATPase subunit b
MHRAEDAVFKKLQETKYKSRLEFGILKISLFNIMHPLLKPEFGLLIWTLVAFLVVFFILKKFAWPAIVKGLKDREQGIADALATAEKVKAEMSQMKSEHEALLAQAREERAQMLKEARETKEKIINESKDVAKVEANKIITEARAAIEAQKMAAITDVKNQVGKMVIEVSEKILRRELKDKNDQETHIRGLVNEVKLN